MFLCTIEECSLIADVSAASEAVCTTVCNFIGSTRADKVDHEALNQACLYLALVAHKDLNWQEVLASPEREWALKALKAEKDSLQSTILIPIPKDHAEYAVAVKEAVSGRYILDFKRASVWKTRGVKQGFKENRLTADGPGFIYYAHVAKLRTVRMLLSRPNRGNRRIAVKDVRTAFLQSNKFPADIIKYISFKDPVTKVIEYFRQTGPIYGEAGAPVRWEQTIAPWLQTEGYLRGDNEPTVFYHDVRDILLLTYVDDLLYDAEEDDIKWADERLEHRFDCKDMDWLEPDIVPLDHLGMELLLSTIRIHLSMQTYIQHTIKLLQLEDLCSTRCPRTPMAGPIDTDSPALCPELRSVFMTGVGCVGWFVETGRPDAAVYHSRVSQHMAAPNESAWAALQRIFHYLWGARYWCLSCETQGGDADLTSEAAHSSRTDTEMWDFYVDSDFAGNTEVQNKRMSQIGIVALQNNFLVFWSSKVSSVAFADADIGESHADTSSGSAEVYAAGNCTYDFRFLAHVAEEMQLDFPRPFKIQMDNTVAGSFTLGTAFKSKLKHIDCRQEWVKVLRDRNICTPVHVDSRDNLADFFTKLLPVGDFERLRSKIMYELPHDG